MQYNHLHIITTDISPVERKREIDEREREREREREKKENKYKLKPTKSRDWIRGREREKGARRIKANALWGSSN